MDQKLRAYYLDFQIKNSTPGQRLVMLYDGLVQNAEAADAELTTAGQTAESRLEASNYICRSINILTELCTSLDHSIDPKLCAILKDLYVFFTRELSEALSATKPEKIRAILPLMRKLRTAWFQADQQANKFQAVAA